MSPSVKLTSPVTLTLEDRLKLNGSLHSARNVTMTALIGRPCATYGTDCQAPQNPRIKAMMITADFGPFRATGLAPAVQTLTRIMADIRSEFPQIHERLGSAGMLCCRLVRGSATAISNHSWGTAIDLTLDGQLDGFADGKIQAGLLDIYPIFNRHGFFWGAGFRREDAMHFEASEQLIRTWSQEGRFGATPELRLPNLTIGDRGPLVERAQLALNRLTPDQLDLLVDGIFGKDTRAAVIAFQREHGLNMTGIITDTTAKALGLSA